MIPTSGKVHWVFQTILSTEWQGTSGLIFNRLYVITLLPTSIVTKYNSLEYLCELSKVEHDFKTISQHLYLGPGN